MFTIDRMRDKLAGIRKLRTFFAAWQRLRAGSLEAPIQEPDDEVALIVPCDPWTVFGSKGDEAMITAAVQNLESEYGVKQIHVLCTSNAMATVSSRGYVPLPLWEDPFSLEAVMKGIFGVQPKKVIVLGADVMDGHYSPFTTNQLLAIADLCFARGYGVSILGFSFNSAPSRHIKRAFSFVNQKLGFKVRDPISLDRFNAFTGSNGRLVADAAFCMQPSSTSTLRRELDPWLSTQRAQKRRVVVINIHPMLFSNTRQMELKQLIDSFASALDHIADRAQVSWLLLPHDYRLQEGDNNCLAPLFGKLKHHAWIHLATSQATASEIKGALDGVDGVVTGRMHLAIAALGMGIPVCAITYQDKFQGLFEHFGLDTSLLLSPAEATDTETLISKIIDFVVSLETQRAMIQQGLPRVIAASRQNFVYSSIISSAQE